MGKDLNRLLYNLCHDYSREHLLEQHKPECQGSRWRCLGLVPDFEALTTKVARPELDLTKSNTQKTPSLWLLLLCSAMWQSDRVTVYRGPDVTERFLVALQQVIIKKWNPNYMHMTPGDWHAHRNADDCHVCNKYRSLSKMLASWRLQQSWSSFMNWGATTPISSCRQLARWRIRLPISQTASAQFLLALLDSATSALGCSWKDPLGGPCRLTRIPGWSPTFGWTWIFRRGPPQTLRHLKAYEQLSLWEVDGKS